MKKARRAPLSMPRANPVQAASGDRRQMCRVYPIEGNARRRHTISIAALEQPRSALEKGGIHVGNRSGANGPRTIRALDQARAQRAPTRRPGLLGARDWSAPLDQSENSGHV